MNERGVNILIFNLAVDADDPVLGFTTRWINEFAKRADRVVVITMRSGRIEVAENVRVISVGAERGYSKLRRAIVFYRVLFRELLEAEFVGCFSHMMPLFSWMGGLLLRLRGIRLVTWYAHPSLTWSVRMAYLASHSIVTSVPNAYPYRRGKLTVIGQGVDTEVFSPGGQAREPFIFCAGRLSRVKDHPTLIEAFARLRKTPQARGVRLVIAGAISGGDATAYRAELEALVAQLGIGDAVDFLPPMPQRELVGWYQRCILHVNMTPSGFGDKVAWEAMSCAAVCIVANTDFAETLGRLEPQLLYRHGDPSDLVRLIEHWLAQPEEQRRLAGSYLRSQVEQLHSVARLANNVVRLFANANGPSAER